ncbi:hypothetical protein F5Y18DRAFT_431559 [Xylariaceae sp. FL1019]|nr:hypothetical protein F5Y18DRAFT_431559 [Xylariaceae sp. FL1019]
MHSISKVSAACLWAVLHTVAAVHSNDSPEGAVWVIQGLPPDYGPWYTPNAEFEDSLNKHPNVTGNYSIAGPDNLDSPSYSPANRWAWSIAVAADLSLDNSQDAPPPDGNGSWYYTGGKITLNTPVSAQIHDLNRNDTINDDLELCIIKWDIDEVAYPDELRKDDGSCTSLLSDECIEDMKAFVQIKNKVCQCPQARDIPSCKKLGGKSELFDSSCYAAYRNVSDIRGSTGGWEGGKYDIFAFGDAYAHHKGNRTSYDNLGSLSWPVMVGFRQGTDGTTYSNLTCVRASEVLPDSEEPTGEGAQSKVSWAGLAAGFLISMIIL